MAKENQEIPRRRDYLVAMIQYMFMTVPELRAVEAKVLAYEGLDSVIDYLARERYKQVLTLREAKQKRLTQLTDEDDSAVF